MFPKLEVEHTADKGYSDPDPEQEEDEKFGRR